MMRAHEQTITVNRLKLIEKLKENLELHKIDYAEAVIGYKIKLIKDLTDKLEEVKSASDVDALKIRAVPFVPPVSYEKEYKDAIIRAEWTESETIELDNTTFKQYIQNEWSWSAGFETLSNSYKAFNVASAMGG